MRRRTAREFNAIRKRIYNAYLKTGYGKREASRLTRKQMAILPLNTDQPVSSIAFVDRDKATPAPAKPMWWHADDAA